MSNRGRNSEPVPTGSSPTSDKVKSAPTGWSVAIIATLVVLAAVVVSLCLSWLMTDVTHESGRGLYHERAFGAGGDSIEDEPEELDALEVQSVEISVDETQQPDVMPIEAQLNVALKEKPSELIEQEKRTADPSFITVPFINHHDVPLDVSWVNYQGVEQMFSTVEPNGRVPQGTYLGHRWVMRANDTSEAIVDVVIEKKHGGGVYSQNPSEYHQRYYEENGIAYLNANPRGPLVKWIPDTVHEGHVVTRQVFPSYYTKENGIGLDDVAVAINVTTLAMRPRIFLVDNFVSSDEADAIVEDAINSNELTRSGVVAADGSLGTFDDARTSTNTWMGPDRSDIVKNIFKRGFNLLNIQFDMETWANHSEKLQVLRYEETQQCNTCMNDNHYVWSDDDATEATRLQKPHHDYFDVVRKSTPGVIAGHNRFATLFIYLSDVDEGGETVFPRVNGVFVDEACTVAEGFKVKPKKGAAALFISMLPDGNPDINSLHGGCPVRKGTKYASNFWFWDEWNAQ